MTRPLRVAVVVDSDAFGGAEVWTRHVLAHLPQGIQPSLLVTRPVAERLGVPEGVEPRIVLPLARHRDAAPEIAAALDVVAPDVVHVNLVDPASNRAALDAALGRAPTVAALHLQGTVPDPGGLRRRYTRLAAAIAPSAAIADQLAELGVPPQRITPVRHGVPLPAEPVPDADTGRPARTECGVDASRPDRSPDPDTGRPARTECGVDASRPDRSPPPGQEPLVVGAVGRLTAQKGVDLLLAAVARLHERGRRLQVVVAGEGRDEAALRRQAEGLPVRFLGFCPDVPALLRRLDAFCLPSRSEALSLALLEAVAHGLPCVATSVGDTATALAGAALIVPADDVDALTRALDRLLADRALRRDLGIRARERAVRDFDVRRMAAEVAAVWTAAGRVSAGEDRVDLGEHVGDR